MNALETIYFPDTTIYTDRQFPLFLLFSPIHIIQPVETDTTASEESKLPDTFMDENFCQVHTPAPLGKDRDRFLHLINDIKNRKDDYAAQLSALTVASMSTAKNRDDNSKSAIVSSLLGSSGVDIEEENTRQEELWQARLVLKIGEILDREEEELAHALTFLEDTELDLFSRLQGKDEDFSENNPYEDLIKLKKVMNQPKIENIKNRLKAWNLLATLPGSPSFPLWVTTRPEAADILLENYEKITGAETRLLLTTALPAKIGKEKDVSPDNLKSFYHEAGKLQEILVENLKSLLEAEKIDFSNFLPEKEEWDAQWKALLDSYFPEQSFGRISLEFHFLDDSKPSSLLNQKLRNESGHGVIAVAR